MSTKHSGHSETKVQRNTKDSSGRYLKADVPIPETVYHYNRYMGGVDPSDQLMKYYNVLRQTKRYWKTLFSHSIDVAVVNAYLLHKECTKQPLSHYEFREQLVRKLCSSITPESFLNKEVVGSLVVSTLTIAWCEWKQCANVCTVVWFTKKSIAPLESVLSAEYHYAFNHVTASLNGMIVKWDLCIAL